MIEPRAVAVDEGLRSAWRRHRWSRILGVPAETLPAWAGDVLLPGEPGATDAQEDWMRAQMREGWR